jgi:DNA topoisomerase VI subunit A
MKNIKDLISLVPSFREPQKDKIIVAEEVRKRCGFEIETKNIDFSNKTLRLNISHVEKSSIFMKQAEILKILKEKLPDRGIEKIV